MRMRTALTRMIFLLGAITAGATARADSFPLTVGDDANCQYRTVQAAMDAVGGDFDYIKVKQGTRSPRVTVPSRVHFVMIVGGFADCADDVPSTDLGDNPSIIDASAGDPGHSAISVAGDTTLLVLRNLVITGANNPRDGGGVYMSTGACPNQLCGLQIDNVRITGNTVSNTGGGIYLYGSPNADEPTVLQLNGSQLSLNNAIYGGAINLGGKVAAEISNTAIIANTAHFGGGINADFSAQTAGDADLVLHANVLLQDNRATTNDGGGMRIAGKTRLLAEEDRISFYGNSAESWGGALDVRGPARAQLGSSGYRAFGGAPMFYANQAYNGGAIAVRTVGADEGFVSAYSRYGNYPVEFQNNVARNAGGAVYVRPSNEIPAYFTAHDFYFRSNVARDGAVVFGDHETNFGGSDVDSRVAFTRRESCRINPDCNVMFGNFVGGYDSGGVFSRTDGALLTAVGSVITIDGTRIASNLVGRVVSVLAEEHGRVQANNLLIDGNDVLVDVARASDSAQFALDGCTIADNAIGTDHVLSVAASATALLSYSIVAQTQNTYSGDPNRIDVNYSVVPELTTFGGDSGNTVDAPVFIDRLGGNYRLAWGSPGIDFAPFRDNPIDNGLDLDRAPRTKNLGAPSNLNPRDAGAYERQDAAPVDDLFKHGFE